MTQTSPVSFTSIAPEQEQLEIFIPSYLDASADLDAPHRPVTNDGRPWFPHNEDHFMTELKLTPCARLLWNWILLKGPAGSYVEIDLCDFRAVTAEHRRGKPYSMKQIRNAASELEQLELMVISKERLRVKARHPGKVVNLPSSNLDSNTGKLTSNTGKLTSNTGKLTSNTGKLTSNTGKLTSKTKPETPDTATFQNASDHTDHFKETAAATPAAAAECEKEKEEEEVQAATPPVGEIEQEAPGRKSSLVDLVALEGIGVVMSRLSLEGIDPAILEKAKDCFQEDKASWKGEMRNPTGWFTRVLNDVKSGTRIPAARQHQNQQLDDEAQSLTDATKNCTISEMARASSTPVPSFSMAETSPRSTVAYHAMKGEYQKAATVAGLYQVDYWQVIDELGLADDPAAYVMARRKV